MSLQGDVPLTLVDILDRASKPLEAKKAQGIVDMLDSVRQYGSEYLGEPDGIPRPLTVEAWTSKTGDDISSTSASYVGLLPFFRHRSCWDQRSRNVEPSRLPSVVSRMFTRRPSMDALLQ
jgi:hypothetical protein